ncbi:MAG: hypothetical protein CL967_06265 [Euryarchaeota archaeon]|nr:hypothetical protein [Euryarchaeota archaeon]
MPCPVCLETFTLTKVIEFECGHCVHEQCLVKMLQKRVRKCPLCRYKFKWYYSAPKQTLMQSYTVTPKHQ